MAMGWPLLCFHCAANALLISWYSSRVGSYETFNSGRGAWAMATGAEINTHARVPASRRSKCRRAFGADRSRRVWLVLVRCIRQVLDIGWEETMQSPDQTGITLFTLSFVVIASASSQYSRVFRYNQNNI